MLIFIPVGFLIHILEEYPQFPIWATKHFGTTTRDWYILTHTILFLLVLFVTLLSIGKSHSGIFLAVATQTIIFTNGLFHVLTTYFFREYSPGVISSILITFPYSYIFYQNVLQNSSLTQPVFIVSIIVGVAISLSIIGSLYLNFSYFFKKQL